MMTDNYSEKKVPAYLLGGIPNLSAWAGATSSFRIKTKKLDGSSPIAMTIEHPPAGQIGLDSQASRFSYVPDKDDTMPFEVVFSAQFNGKPISQTITVTPIPIIKPERDYVSKYPELPDPSGSLYITITKQVNADESENHLISGMRVVFNKKDDANHLFQSYHKDPGKHKLPDQPTPKGTIRNLTICADKLVVHGELWLPETNVYIFARKMIFKDQDNKMAGIITSASPFAKPRADDQKNGAPGRKAGDITIYINHFEVDDPSTLRFRLRGGKGQDAGLGAKGQKGNSVDCFSYHEYGVKFLFGNTDSLAYHFVPPAIYLDLLDYAGIIGGIVEHRKRIGHGQWPADGKNAKKPGKPGDGGDGGNFTGYFGSSQDAQQDKGLVDTSGEKAGLQAKNVTGGRKGTPSKCAKWQVKLRNDGFVHLHRHSQTKTEERETKDGTSYTAPEPEKKRGNDGACEIKTGQGASNTWLHPSLLQTVLLYVRDAYLSAPQKVQQLASLLDEYKTALQSRPSSEKLQPIIEQSGAGYSETLYDQTLTEVITMLHRIESHTDYFGYPCGWTPLFSLPVCLQMYEDEIDHALKTLVLAKWIQQKATQAQETVAITDESINSLNQETDQALEQIESAKDNIKKLREQAHALQQEIINMSVRLDKKRNDLMSIADQEARTKALINFGVSSVSALCQVIPYGQPALGALGSAGQVIADTVINADDPIDAAGPLSDILGDFAKAKLDEKAGEIVKAAKAKKEEDPKAKDAAHTAAKLTHVGKTIGPALTSIADGIKGLNVPQTEVDARLRRLEAECPEFKEFVRDLEALNVRKAEFAQKLNESLQSLISGFAKVTANLLAINSMKNQQREELAVLDHEALLYARIMDQRARFMLVKYLYFLAKCYEYSVLEPIPVNFQLSEIFDKITPLLERENIGEAVTKLTNTLSPLFKTELRKIEDKLKTNYVQEYRRHLEIRLSVEQTPTIVSQLNATGSACINLRDFNCILPDSEKIKIAGLEVESLEFETDSQPVPESGSVDFTMEPMGVGAMRAGNALYVVRHPTSANSATVGRDSQQVWGVTYHFGSKKMDPIRPSEDSLELLDSLMGHTDKSIREKIAKPTAWTDLKVHFARHVRAPNLKSVILKWHLNVTPADDSYCVLDVRMCGPYAPLLQCSPEDVNGRNDGFGQIYRIYPKGVGFQLSAPLGYGKKAFSHWEVIDNTDTMEPREVQESVLEIDKIEHNMQVFTYYEDREEPQMVIREQSASVREFIATRFNSLPSENEIEKFIDKDFKQFQENLAADLASEMKAKRHGWSSRVLNEPTGFSVGYLPQQAEFAVLDGPKELEGKEWMKIDYQGVVGWVTTTEE